MGKTLRKKHEKDKRKIMKYMIQFANHYGVFYFESFKLGKDWNIVRYSMALFSFSMMAKSCGALLGFKEDKDSVHKDKRMKFTAGVLFLAQVVCP